MVDVVRIGFIDDSYFGEEFITIIWRQRDFELRGSSRILWLNSSEFVMLDLYLMLMAESRKLLMRRAEHFDGICVKPKPPSCMSLYMDRFDGFRGRSWKIQLLTELKIYLMSESLGCMQPAT